MQTCETHRHYSGALKISALLQGEVSKMWPPPSITLRPHGDGSCNACTHTHLGELLQLFPESGCHTPPPSLYWPPSDQLWWSGSQEPCSTARQLEAPKVVRNNKLSGI